MGRLSAETELECFTFKGFTLEIAVFFKGEQEVTEGGLVVMPVLNLLEVLFIGIED